VFLAIEIAVVTSGPQRSSKRVEGVEVAHLFPVVVNLTFKLRDTERLINRDPPRKWVGG
jgi:hypothetical protein